MRTARQMVTKLEEDPEKGSLLLEITTEHQ
jgi:hypothetical protein